MSSRYPALPLLVCFLAGAAPPKPDPKPADDPLPPGALVRLGRPHVQQFRQVCSVAYSPDGTTLAVSSDNRPMTLWDARSGKPVRRFPDERFGYSGGHRTAYSPDGRLLAGLDKACAWLFDVKSVKQVRVLSDEGGLSCFAFSPDGKTLATGTGVFRDRVTFPVLLWDLKTGKVIRRFVGHARATDQLAFSLDGKTLTSLSEEAEAFGGPKRIVPGAVMRWEVGTGRRLSNQEGIRPLVLFADGSRFTQAGKEGDVEVWDVRKKARLRTLDALPTSHVVSPDGKLLADMNDQQTIRILDIASGRTVKKLSNPRRGDVETSRGDEVRYFPFVFSPDGRFLATGGCTKGNHAGAVRLWDLAGGKELLPAEDHFAAVTCLTFSPDGKAVASGSADRTARLWDAKTGRFLRAFTGHRAAIDFVALSPNGRTLATSDREKAVRLWEVATGRERHLLERRDDKVASICFSPDGKSLQVIDVRGLVFRYEVATGKLAGRSRLARDGFASPYLGPDGALARDEAVSHLLPPAVRAVPPRQWPYLLARVSADGRLAATGELASLGGFGGTRYRICVWEVATGGLILDREATGEAPSAFAFSADGRTLFVGNGNWWDRGNGIRSYDLIDWTTEQHDLPTRSNLLALACSPDGTRLASAASDATVLIWSADALSPSRTMAKWSGQLSLREPPVKLRCDDTDVKRAWGRLGGPDARIGYRAEHHLANAPGESVPLLRRELKALSPGGEALRALIADLDDDDFTVRETAARRLAGMGDLAGPALRRALLAPPSAEARRTLARLARRLTAPGKSRPSLQVLRGVAALERIGTAEARAALRELAKAGPDTLLGTEAEAALLHLSWRPAAR